MFRPVKLELVNFLSHTNTVFEFKQGKAILVVGENLDKEGTKGNGAGKSSLNEGISVALIGSSIRDVKPRELVRNGEEYSIVRFELHNTINKTTLIVERKLYSKESKSSECKIWESGVEVTNCPDINTYNKWILNHIGISKEDFYNFFLITKEQYTPFLSVGDTKKKEIINRFSGANSVDKTEELIDIDSKKVESLILGKRSELISCQGKQSVYSEQIEKEEQAVCEEEISSKKLLIDSEISQVNKNIVFKEEELQATKTEVFTKEVELAKKIKEEVNVTDLEKLTLEKEQLLTNRQIFLEKSKNVTSKFQAEIDEIKSIDEETRNEIKVLEKANYVVKESRVQLENQLVGLIDCPKCSHQFSLKNKELSIEEVKKQIEEKKTQELENQELISEYNSILTELEEQKESINRRIVSEREIFTAQIEDIDKKVLTITTSINQLNIELVKHKNTISNLEVEIQSLRQKVEQITYQIANFKEQVSQLLHKKTLLDNKDTSRIEELKLELKKQIDLEEKLKLEVNELELSKQKVDAWYINFKNFKSHLANQSIKNITDYTNYFLNSIGSNITINIEGYRMMSNKKLKEEITTLVYKDGFEEGSYGKFSAGERGRIEISVILAMQELINLNCSSGGLDLLICDEILDSVDDLGLESIINALQGLEKTIMIVSQNQINSLKENTITIRKQNKVSIVIENN